MPRSAGRPAGRRFDCSDPSHGSRHAAKLVGTASPDAGPGAQDGCNPWRSSPLGRMCGRYASFLPAEALARLFGTTGPLPNLEPTWNMAPTKAVPIVRLDPKTGERRLEVAKWGLVPFFTKEPSPATTVSRSRWAACGTRAAAENAAAKAPRATVVEAFDKVWLYSAAGEDWHPVGGEHVADIGTLPTKPGTKYTARYMEAVFHRRHEGSGPSALRTRSMVFVDWHAMS
jgi:hypothetical protein